MKSSHRIFKNLFSRTLGSLTEWVEFGLFSHDCLIFHLISQERKSYNKSACYLAVVKPISGCVCIACSGLMITSPLQVVNRLDAS